MNVGEYDKAKILLDQALLMAYSINDIITLVRTYIIMAKVSIKKGDYTECIESCDQGLAIYEKNKKNEISIVKFNCNKILLFNKGMALLKMKHFSQVQEIVEQGLSLSKENETHTINFNVLGHLMTLDDDTSTNYIENIAIPHYMSSMNNFKALDMCRELEQHYKKKKLKKKELAISVTMQKIYEEVFMSDVDFGE